MIVQRSAIAFFVTALGLAACSGEPDDNGPDGSGGTAGDGDLGSGGVSGPSGGAGNSGGAVGTGGAGTTGGAGNTGGAGDTGGAGNTGGAGDTGGGNGTGGDGTGGDGSGGSNGEISDGPCDIYEDAGTPCAAAYSPIRRIKSDYTGPLYQVRVGSSEFNIGGQRVTNPVAGPQADQPYQTVPEAGTLLDIPQAADGFVDTSVLEGACSTTAIDNLPDCSVVQLYDQSGNETHIPVAGGGLPNGGTWAEYDNFETMVNDSSRLTVGGRTVYSLYMEPRNGYRIEEVGAAMPLDSEAQGIYMLADGTHAGGACCWDFGNVTTNPASYAEMNTLFFGEAYWGDGNGSPPWFGADFEAGVWMGGSVVGDPGWGELNAQPAQRPPNTNSPSFQGVEFALGFLKTDDDEKNTYALRMANINEDDAVHEAYRGDYPKWSYANGGHGTDNRGAVVLGVGGDNSNNSAGTFYEGAIVAGFPTDAAEQAVMENIQSVGYGE